MQIRYLQIAAFTIPKEFNLLIHRTSYNWYNFMIIFREDGLVWSINC
jgi:hypothetical protein